MVSFDKGHWCCVGAPPIACEEAHGDKGFVREIGGLRQPRGWLRFYFYRSVIPMNIPIAHIIRLNAMLHPPYKSIQPGMSPRRAVDIMAIKGIMNMAPAVVSISSLTRLVSVVLPLVGYWAGGGGESF